MKYRKGERVVFWEHEDYDYFKDLKTFDPDHDLFQIIKGVYRGTLVHDVNNYALIKLDEQYYSTRGFRAYPADNLSPSRVWYISGSGLDCLCLESEYESRIGRSGV